MCCSNALTSASTCVAWCRRLTSTSCWCWMRGRAQRQWIVWWYRSKSAYATRRVKQPCRHVTPGGSPRPVRHTYHTFRTFSAGLALGNRLYSDHHRMGTLDATGEGDQHMAHATYTELGAVVSLWRYPVKSMLGEEVHTAQVRDHGLLGDRVYALLDNADGKVATAKNPRKWPHLFAFQATCIESSGSSVPVPPVRITLPDGTSVTSEHSALNQVLSQALNREVTLAATERGPGAITPAAASGSWTVQAEEFWPDIDGLDYRDTVTD